MMRKLYVPVFILGSIVWILDSCKKQKYVEPAPKQTSAFLQSASTLTLATHPMQMLLVTTVAGDGTKGILDTLTGSAAFNGPTGICTDATGNIYVSDRFNRTIRKVALDGTVTLLAGFAGAGNLVDGQGDHARFSLPWGVATDAAGNVYVSDVGNNRIREVTPDGFVSTIAGSGSTDFLQGGFADGPAFSSKFNSPEGLAVDAAGNIYIADATNNRIRKLSGQMVTTIAGGANSGFIDGQASTARFNEPAAVAVDGSGNVYVADEGNHSIRKISSSGVVTTLAGNGTAGYADGTGSAAQFNNPTAISIDANGNLYVADASNQRIRKVTAAGVVTTLAGSGTAGFLDQGVALAQFNGPVGLTLDGAGNIFVADAGNERIRKIGLGLLPGVNTLAGNGVAGNKNGTGGYAQFNVPTGMTFDPTGNLYVAEQGNQLIRKISQGGVVTTYAGSRGGYLDGSADNARFDAPTALAADASGNIFVADQINQRIRKIATDGTVSTIAGTGTRGFVDGPGNAAQFNYPCGIAIDALGNLYVADANNNRIRKIDPSGKVITLAGDGTSAFNDGPGNTARFNSPIAVATDAAGNVYVSDRKNNKIRKIDPSGTVTTLAGSKQGFADGAGGAAQFNLPGSIVVDAAGNVYVADQGNQRIRKITPDGNVSTIAGTATAGYLDALNSFAMFNQPYGIAIDGAGHLFIADQNNNAIRIIE